MEANIDLNAQGYVITEFKHTRTAHVNHTVHYICTYVRT